MNSFRKQGLAALALPLLLAVSGSVSAQTILSSNLSNTTGGTETATGTVWIADSFGTGTATSTLNSVTLLLANTGSSTGAAELDLYSNGLLAPGSLLGKLTSPGSYATSAANTTFTSSGLTLSANTTYWVVLKATSGAFDWSWTTDSTGTGTGFQGVWADTQDSGTTWFSDNVYPFQMSVTASAVTAVPEPGAPALIATSCTFGAGLLLRRRRSAAL